jgi:competence protein ComFC
MQDTEGMNEINNSKNPIRTVLGFLLDLIFPIHCLDCGMEGEWLCENCRQALKKRHEPQQIYVANGNYLDEVIVAADFKDEIVEKLVKSFKYQLVRNLAGSLSGFLTDASICKGINGCEYGLIPVPLHKRRLRWRGFNQAELLASALARKTQQPIFTALLLRVKYNIPQAQLKARERTGNMHGCFAVSEPERVRGGNFILVDDVVTTGSTMNECARILKENGAVKVIGLAFAHG